jgi:hypothetical protein
VGCDLEKILDVREVVVIANCIVCVPYAILALWSQGIDESDRELARSFDTSSSNKALVKRPDSGIITLVLCNTTLVSEVVARILDVRQCD